MLLSMFDCSMNKANSPVIAFESFIDLTNWHLLQQVPSPKNFPRHNITL